MAKPKKKNDGDITPVIILQHMHAMGQRLEEKVDGVEKKVDALDRKVDHNHAQLTVQLDNIDKRLDDIEVVEVPKLKKAIGIR